MPILRAASILSAIVLAACVFGDDRNHGRPDGNTSDPPDASKEAIDAEPPPPDAPECTPHEELCNGLDDDCDDERDEDWPVGQHCTVPTACPPDGMYVCRGDGAGVVCMAGGGNPEPELCEDGVDNDCMGGDA